jgi:aryl-alcohol dehydrogenase-like predicted oxidoreductase
MLPLCRAEGIGVIPWSPLARGRLTRDQSETTKRHETDQFAAKLYTSTAEADGKVVAARGRRLRPSAAYRARKWPWPGWRRNRR